jgi:beta-galactosidase GanA
MNKNYLFGSVYIIEKDYTLDEIRKDLKNMKDMGFNLITLWPVSNPWLAKTTTEHVFTLTRTVLDICEELSLKAILQLFGQNIAQEFMPDSLFHMDMMIQDEEGGHINQNCFWANLNHERVRALIDGYFKEAILSLKDHSALYAWDIFNEAHFRSDDPYTLKLYQEWLQEKYQDIHHLNTEWYRRYQGFYDITPAKRRSSYSVWSSILPEVEYEKFRSENVTAICQFLYDTAKKYDDQHPMIIDGTSSQILYDKVIERNNDEFETAYIPDIYGGTFYPKSWGRNFKEMPWMSALYYLIPSSAARKAHKPYFVNELQTHTQSVLTPGSEVEPDELCNWTWMCIFHGADGMQLWRQRPFLHGYQTTGRGLTRLDGTTNQRGLAITELVKTLSQNSDIFGDFAVSKPQVKIAISYHARLVFDCFSKWQKNIWPEAVAGWYRAFWKMGVQIDMTNLSKMSAEDLSCPIIVLPSILSMSDETIAWLTHYVEQGGILIADARFSSVNEVGVAPSEGIPGKKLTALFGIKELDVSSKGTFLLEDEPINANFMYQDLWASEDTEVIGRMENGMPAVTIHPYGKGKAIYFNSFIGVEMAKGVPAAMERFLKSLIPDAVTVTKSEHVHISYITTKGSFVMLATNFSDADEAITLHNVDAYKQAKNLMTGQIDAVSNTFSTVVPKNKSHVIVFS